MAKYRIVSADFSGADEVLGEVEPDAEDSTFFVHPSPVWVRERITPPHLMAVDRELLLASVSTDRWRSSDAAPIGGDVLFTAQAAKIARAVREAKLPAIFPWRDSHEQGVLISYGPALRDVVRRGAYYVGRILKGAKPADLPVEQVSKFDLVINLRVAREMRIHVPATQLFRSAATSLSRAGMTAAVRRAMMPSLSRVHAALAYLKSKRGFSVCPERGLPKACRRAPAARR